MRHAAVADEQTGAPDRDHGSIYNHQYLRAEKLQRDDLGIV